MADQSDVAYAVVDRIGQALLRKPYNKPEQANRSINGLDVRIYAGWPLATSSEFKADQAASVHNITVYALPAMGANVSRLGSRTVSEVRVPKTLMASVTGNTATFSGTCSSGQIAGLGLGNVGVAYRVTDQDTPRSVAAALAGHMPFATVQGSTITLGRITQQPLGGLWSKVQVTDKQLVARVASDALVTTEIARQSMVLAVNVWATTPQARDQLARELKVALHQMGALRLDDGSWTSILRFNNELNIDAAGAESVWRREIRLGLDYATTLQETFTEVLFSGGQLIVNNTSTGFLGTKLLD